MTDGAGWSRRERTQLVVAVSCFVLAAAATVAILVDFASPGSWWTVAGTSLSGVGVTMALVSSRRATRAERDSGD